jgi:predicted ATPase
MAHRVVQFDGLLKMVVGTGKVAEIKADGAGNAVRDHGLGTIRLGRGFAQEELRHFAHRCGLLAEAEASAGQTEAGLRRLDDAFAELERTEERWYEAEMRRIRGEILLKSDLADTAAAERSLQAAIAIAQPQKARSFELRAALSLARLYRTANRDADAHAILAPAVEGFPPTHQFPELIEAQTLLAALSESDAVKSAAALSQRRLHLQTSLGNALIWVKGRHAPETAAAFARARELANRVEDTSERFAAYNGLWMGHSNRCEPAPMREMAELFLREATGPPGLLRGGGRSPHFGHDLLLFRRFCRRSGAFSQDHRAL